MDDWIDLPAGFADLAQAKAWSKSLEQAKGRVELLRLVELVFRLEALFKARPELASLDARLSRERPGLELCVWVQTRDDGVAELDAWLAKRRERDWVAEIGPLGPDEEKRALQDLCREANALEDLTRSEPGALDGAAALRPYQTVHVSRESSSWREICQAFGAEAALRAIERAQIEQETQSGRARQEPRAL